MIAFKEAVEKYDESKGSLLNFVKVVIRSRVIDYLRKEKKNEEMASLDSMAESGVQFQDESRQSENVLAIEIEEWKSTIEDFDISLEQLIEESPKHKDSRERAIHISEKSSKHKPITIPLFEKKRLPIKLTATYNNVSVKVIKGNKVFITSTIIIFKNGLASLIDWIKRG